MTTTVDRVPDVIGYGKHASPAEGACVMEMVALFAGEPFGDRPACACPVITQFALGINDRMPDDATRTRLLGPLVPLIAGSRSTPAVERVRALLAADVAVRAFAPIALEAAQLTKEATTLRALPAITDRATAQAGRRAAAAAAAGAAADLWTQAARCIQAMCAVSAEAGR